MIKVDNLIKMFGGIVALNGLSFEALSGEIVGIIGPNGAGKTTLFENLSGFEHPTKGEIFYKKNRINSLSPHKIRKLGIGRTFQLEEKFQEFTCYEAVFAAALSHFPFGEAHNQTEQVLESIGLSNIRDNYPDNMTAFERKLLQIAVMIASPLEVALFDEIMAGLSPAETQHIMGFLQDLRDKDEVTVIVIEHVMPVIMALCDRIIVLNFGVKVAEGTPQEIVQDQRVIDAYLGGETSVDS